jgi:CHAT domain-containing protein/Tfp pilus assembly protein PilF
MTISFSLRHLPREFVRVGAVCLLLAAACIPVQAQFQRWYDLSEQAVQLKNQGNNAAALPIEQQAEQVAEATWGANDQHVALSLNVMGILEMDLEKYADAETHLKRSIGIFTNLEGSQGKDLAGALDNLGLLYQELARFPDAEKMTQQALAIQVKLKGENDPDVATAESNLALIYEKEDKYDDAEALYQKAIATDESHADAGKIELDFAGLGKLYAETGKYARAEQASQQELAEAIKAYGPQDARVASPLNDLAVDYALNGKLVESEQAYGKALALATKASSPDAALISQIEVNMGSLYRNEGKYAQAEQLMLQALASRAKALGPNHPDVASVLASLGLLYEYEMRFSDAERALRQALDIDTKALGAGSVQVAHDMRDLAELYGSHGQSGPADQLYYNAIQIYLKVMAQAPKQTANVVFAGAEQFMNDGNLDTAAKLFNSAGGIFQQTEGAGTADVAKCQDRLGTIAETMGRHDDAERLHKSALATYEKLLGPDDIRLVDPLEGLGRVYQDTQRFADAEPEYLRALKIEQAHLKANDPSLRYNEADLAALYYAWGKPAQAAPYFQSYLGNLMDEFRSNAATMSERERLIYFSTWRGAFPLFFSFVVKYHDQILELTGEMYDDLLQEKGLVAASAASMRAAVEASGNPQAVQMLDKLASDKAQLAALVEDAAGNQANHQTQINQLGDEANTLEQSLMKSSAVLIRQRAQNAATWRDVQKALKPGESAVEVTRFQFDNGMGPTADSFYVALVVTPDCKEPIFVDLGTAKDLEAGPMLAYRDDVAQTRGMEEVEVPAAGQTPATAPNTGAAYAAFWKPLEPALNGAKRVYISPDGVLDTIPMGLMTDSDGKLLMEKTQLRIVNSTKDLLLPPAMAGGQTRNALLVGNPKFDLSGAQQKTALAELQRGATGAGTEAPQGLPPVDAPAKPVEVASRGGDLAGGDLNPLPGTQEEVDTVDGLLKNAGWQASEYTGDLALKQAMTQAHAPRIVHIATHGFFLSDEELKANAAAQGATANVNEDPMLRSGLFFAGADRVREGAAPEAGVDDGVLTAFEASQLNLQGTELVVLSACETGLGKVLNSDGVFGLRRGLQEAGADAVMMSMWSVPDKETQELMAGFYKNWTSGLEKPEALRQAQLAERETVKKRYGKDLPFYWGAFVMVGR